MRWYLFYFLVLSYHWFGVYLTRHVKVSIFFCLDAAITVNSIFHFVRNQHTMSFIQFLQYYTFRMSKSFVNSLKRNSFLFSYVLFIWYATKKTTMFTDRGTCWKHSFSWRCIPFNSFMSVNFATIQRRGSVLIHNHLKQVITLLSP